MDPHAFVEQLGRSIEERLAGSTAAATRAEEPDPAVTVLLYIALQNELEAAEEAALWLVGESDRDVKLALMRQCGDEAKHYRLIEQRLAELGEPPVPTGPTPARSGMFAFLASLPTTVERLAAGPFAREALAQVRNEVFAAYCEAKGDGETARLYREIIQPDEAHHHALGRKLLPRFAVDEESQARATEAVARVLAIAGEAQEIARLKRGLTCLPGC